MSTLRPNRPATVQAPNLEAPFDWSGSFLRSSYESFGELVGIKPSLTTQKWRQEHPVADIFSQVIGFGVPYVGWFKATKALKGFDRAIETIGDLQKHPIATGAARGAARFAPFEAGRVGISQVVGDEDLESMTADAIISLAIEGGVGGLLGGFASAGTRALPLDKLVPGLDMAAPTQLQTRFIQKAVSDGTLQGDAAAKAQYRLLELRRLARAERLPAGVRYVGELDGVSKAGADTINRYFNLSKRGSLLTRMLVQMQDSSKGFRRGTEWQQFATDAGLGANFEDYVQFPRAVTFRGSKDRALATAGRVDKSITSSLEPVGDNWFVAREAEEGLFVAAKKVTGKTGTADASDRWLLFKTDVPGQFMPAQQRWANVMTAQSAWVPGSKIAADGGPIYNLAARLMEEIPLRNYFMLAKAPGGVREAISKIMPKNVRGESNELVGRVRDAVKEYMAPARIQFRHSPHANWIHNIMRSAYDMAETEAQKMLYGILKIDRSKSLFRSMLKGQQEEEVDRAIKPLIDKLTDKEVEEVWKVWREGMPDDKIESSVLAGFISRSAADAAKLLRSIDNDLWSAVQKTQGATGNTVTKSRAGHMMVSRQWEGDHRIVLRADNNAIIAQAGGSTKKAAQKNAERLRKVLEDEGQSVHIAEAYDVSDLATIPKELRPALVAPGFLKERQNIRGFNWDLDPFTKKELMDTLTEGVYARHKYMANMTVDDLLAQHMARLAKEDPTTWRMLTQRFNDNAGVQSDWGRMQNITADRILAPLLGKNSATQIVRTANNVMWHLQLGAMKMSYPVVNAIQFIQTVAPEIAYITGAAPERLAGTYTYFAAGGTKGPAGIVGALSPMKLLGKSMKEMWKPDKGLLDAFERATRERVIDPRLVEEYVGEQSAKVIDLKTAISSPGGFVRWLAAISEWAPAQSERFARTHAFTTGHILGRDYLRLNGDELFTFSKQFTENTSYLYSVADRPRMFTTPSGSAFGLFKNWMTNYTASMLTYSGEALKGNFAPLLWQTAGMGAVGGVSATPLYLVANGFSNMFADKSLLELTYDLWGEDAGDAINFGLPAALTGASLYSQAATPLANPARDATLLFSLAHYDRMQATGRLIGEAWDHYQATGENPARSQRVRDQMARAFAPTTIYKIMGAIQEEGIKSLGSGLPITTEASAPQKFLYMMGFTPVEMERGLAVASQLFEERNARQAEVNRLGQAYAEAMMEKNGAAMRILLRQAVISGVDPSSVLRSAQARREQQTESLWERNFKAEDVARFRSVLSGQ